MRRVVVGIALAIGMLCVGVTDASAHTFCSLDPTLGIGTPLKYTVNVYLVGSTAYLSGNHSSTTVSGSVGLP
jgi:hypothetical protein